MKKLPIAATIIKKSILNLLLNIREFNPSLAISYPAIIEVAMKNTYANDFNPKINSRDNPDANNIVDKIIIYISLLNLINNDPLDSNTHLALLHALPEFSIGIPYIPNISQYIRLY